MRPTTDERGAQPGGRREPAGHAEEDQAVGDGGEHGEHPGGGVVPPTGGVRRVGGEVGHRCHEQRAREQPLLKSARAVVMRRRSGGSGHVGQPREPRAPAPRGHPWSRGAGFSLRRRGARVTRCPVAHSPAARPGPAPDAQRGARAGHGRPGPGLVAAQPAQRAARAVVHRGRCLCPVRAARAPRGSAAPGGRGGGGGDVPGPAGCPRRHRVLRRLVGVGRHVAGAGGDLPRHGLGPLLPRRPAPVEPVAPSADCRRRGLRVVGGAVGGLASGL